MPMNIHLDLAGTNHGTVQEKLNRLAAEIHDGLTQHFSAICLQLAVAKELISSTGGDPLSNIQQAIELANLGLAETRRCAHNLAWSVVNESGLTAALQCLAERWSVPSRLRCDFRCENVPEDRLSDASKHQLLQIAQEAIHNAVRHANPTLIAVTLYRDARNVVLEVRDNGLGIPAGGLAKCEGVGLGNMKRRAREIAGRFKIKTAAGQGTSVIVTLPLPG